MVNKDTKISRISCSGIYRYLHALDTRSPRVPDIFQRPEKGTLSIEIFLFILTFPRSALLIPKAEALAKRVAITASFMVTVVEDMLTKIPEKWARRLTSWHASVPC